MPATVRASVSRVVGNDAVLDRLARLGRNPRTFANLVHAGLPPQQLSEASQWFSEQAGTPVERYASQNLQRGYFEDETLLTLFCRYFDCTDWKLESSPWFFSRSDYTEFNAALSAPVEFHTAQLEQGHGEQMWSPHFHRLPFALGMEQARQALWQDICRKDHYWRPHQTYAHLRAETLFAYLQRTLNIVRFSPHHFNYHWERRFREQFHTVLRRFEEVLESSLSRWQEQKKEKTRGERFQYRSYVARDGLIPSTELMKAFALLGLQPGKITLTVLRKSFRRLSKQTHPDHGGTPEAFQKLSRAKDLIEAWLGRQAPAR